MTLPSRFHYLRFVIHCFVAARSGLIGLLILFIGVPSVAADTTLPQSREQILLSYAPVVQKTAPAVVNIYTTTIVKQRRMIPLFSDPFFQQFFGDQFGQKFGQPKERVQNSLGSGVIINSNGTIVTNNHVIEGADKIRVVLTDRREFNATLVGVDERTDLAMLRIDSKGESLPFIELSDSDQLQVGDLVLAIGNPFGVGQTVTSGIISGLTRTQVGVADIGSFIQTDAAINPGNSGGALVAMDGKLAGINTAIFSNNGGSLGIGFAVPANMVRYVIDGLGANGRVVRPWLGAWGQVVSGDIANSLGLARPEGVMVTDVWPGSAADRAGIHRGDIILEINDKPVSDPMELEFKFASLHVGDKASFITFRSGKRQRSMVTLEAASAEPAAETTKIEGRNPLTGLTIANMSPALGEELKLDHISPGVIIVGVQRGSPAGRLGFRPMDKLLSAGGADIASVGDVKKIVTSERSRWDVTIERGGDKLSLVVGQ